MAETSEVTRLLTEWGSGNQQALDALLPLVYDELHRLAAGYLRRESPGHTLQPTALVNEAFLRLCGQREVTWQNRAHFFGIAARLMRRVLLHHAEAKSAAKRGGQARRVAFDEALKFFQQRDLDLFALDEALTRLAEFDSQQANIVELRFFGGLTIEETAEITGVSPATVKREWGMAKVWLLRELTANAHKAIPRGGKRQ